MRGRDIKYLAGVADLARLDMEAASLTLIGEGDRLTAVYGGMYSHGWRYLPLPDVPTFRIAVKANQFKTLVGLFGDDAEVSLRRTEKNLRIVSSDSRIDFREWGEEYDPERIKSREVEMSAKLPIGKLIAEANAASAFVAESMVKAVLTGIRLEIIDPPVKGEDHSIQFSAYNGFGALYESAIAVKARGHGSIVVPNADFLLGIQLMGGNPEDEVTVAKTVGRENVAVFNDHALFRSSIIAGEWPDTGRITSIRNKTRIKVASGQIRALASSVKALGASADIDVTASKGRVVFSVNGEAGRFTTTIRGELPKRGLKFDAGTLILATRLGEELTMALPEEPDMPTVVDANGRRCWIVTRV